jgi:hypothetical protein
MNMRYYAEAIRRRTGDDERVIGEALDEVFGTVSEPDRQLGTN